MVIRIPNMYQRMDKIPEFREEQSFKEQSPRKQSYQKTNDVPENR